MSSRTSVKEQTGSGISWGKTILAAIVAACLAWLVAGVTLHLGSVEPAQRLSISEQAKSLAKELDAALKIRAAVVMSVVYNRSLEKLLASTGLDNFANFIHGQLSDFLSLEMLNDNGEVVAMIGELPLSQADLSSKDAGENVFRKDPRAFVTGIFRDDPVNGCFFLTCRHRNGDGTYWYTRTRFTRRVIEGLLNEFQGRASLVSISGGKHDLEVVYGHPTRTYGSSWSGLQSVEATLESPGWLVKVAAEDNVSPFRRKSIILPAIALVFTIIACFLWPRIRISEPWKKDSQGSGATEIPAGRESGRSFDTTKESAGTKNRAKPELSGRIEAPGLPRQNELFAAYFADDYRPGENQATSKRDESYEDYFCPSQLIFEPVAEEFEPTTVNSSGAVGQSIIAEPLLEVATESIPHESSGESQELWAEADSDTICEEILIVQSPSESTLSEESLSLTPEEGLPEELEVFWEDETDPYASETTPKGLSPSTAAAGPHELVAKTIPDVLDLEWEEPAADPPRRKKNEQPREAVLFSEFFNC